MADDSNLVKNTGRKTPPNAGKGRPKGSPNKSTKAVKEALDAAFEGMGGVKALTTWATSDPGEFYKLWVKMLPIDAKLAVGDPDGNPLQIIINKPA